ncbi:LAGLIDADG family homing endonuclease [Thermococcus sp.]|uniref:LAGLIDADG family homing endonuclease n=2 Tax=Thermococcus sp. TaxID=35749 RepID=UPI0026023CB6|nr:LAGLIDADG family homing endonuclease [Thermococcus sp.]MCD6144048.1 DNA endonuclease [Thermococcus sp.]
MRTIKELDQEELQDLLEYVKDLRKRGLSYSEIVKRILEEKGIKVSRPTVLRWCKGQHNSFAKLKPVNLTPSPALSYIIGAYFGDASISFYEYKYRIRLKVIDKEFVEAFARALEDIGANYRVGYENNPTRSDRWYVESTNKFLYMFLKQPKERLFEIAKEYPKEFLRGLFDSEGCVYLEPTNKKVSYVSIHNYDLEVLEFSKGLLASLGIHSKIRLSKKAGTPVMIRGEQYFYKNNLYELRIYRIESVKKFAREVGFTISRKQNKLEEWLKYKFTNVQKYTR